MTTAFWPSSSVAVRLERQVRRPLEHHGDLGDPLAEPLAGAQVERHPGPAAGVDVEAHRGIRLGASSRGRRRPRRGSRRPPRRPASRAAYWPRAVPAARSAGSRTAESTFSFSSAQALGVEGDRLLHRGERHQLQEVVLDDVARGADAVVVAGPAADADVLGHGDLHVVDVVGVPDRLEHLVGEAQRQQVLHGLLAQVVVDPEHRVGREDVLDDGVELARRLQVVAERLLDDDPAPRPRLRVESPERSSCWQTVANDDGRDRQVEGVVAAGAALLVELGDHLGEQVEGRRRRRRCPARTGCPRRACARPPRGTACGPARAPTRRRSCRSPGRPSRAGRTRSARSPAAAGRGWRGRRSPASASCGRGRR